MHFKMVFAIALVSAAAAAPDSPALKTQKEKISYALGMDLGNQLRKSSIEVDPALFGRGLRDALSGAKTLLTDEQVRAVISEFQSELKRKEAARRKGTSEEDSVEAEILPAYNKKAGAAFLAANRTKEGVVTLPSGLQYKVLQAGSGKKPTEADTVVCHYRGALIDGTEFDSSYKRNQPATTPVKAAIAGWREALRLMSVGSKWRLFIPPELAYGETGNRAAIGPNATVVFDVELLAVK
jgi:FKBP-type peptidyl-prolyl cis-trans isomerase